MQWHGIVNLGSNSILLEMCNQFVALRRPNDELIVNMTPARTLNRQLRTSNMFTIQRRIALTPFRPSIQIFQLHSQYRRLNRIQTKIAPKNLVVILRAESMISQQHHAIRKFRTVGDHHATVTKSAEIL